MVAVQVAENSWVRQGQHKSSWKGIGMSRVDNEREDVPENEESASEGTGGVRARAAGQEQLGRERDHARVSDWLCESKGGCARTRVAA